MKIEELRKIVAAATPGPWVTPEWDDGVWTEPRAEKSGCICKLDCSCVQNPNKDPDAQFITTFSPSLVARLLDVVEAAQYAAYEPGVLDGTDEPGVIVSPGLKAVRDTLRALEGSDDE